MQDNPFTFLGLAISQLLSSKSTVLQATGLDIFRGLAVILIVWFGVKSAPSALQGFGGGFQFAKFAGLILIISFGLGMLTCCSTPIPGVCYSFSDLMTQEALNLSGEIESDQTQQIATTMVNAEQQLGTSPGSFNILEDQTFLIIALLLAAMQAVSFAVIAYGYVASAICVLIGPIFILWFIVPKLDWLFWGWFKAFIGLSFYLVTALAFIYIFSKVLTSMFSVIGTISILNALTILPALFITLLVCIFGLLKIPELTESILSGRSGTENRNIFRTDSREIQNSRATAC
ncbi:type IV secretion system protein [Telmatobacter bradus]|uniref:type IV secretion system protein n=1 Tax=Telmatobacter bradus TaxID=474953 RepID=UPI003B43B5F1